MSRLDQSQNACRIPPQSLGYALHGRYSGWSWYEDKEMSAETKQCMGSPAAAPVRPCVTDAEHPASHRYHPSHGLVLTSISPSHFVLYPRAL